MTTLLVKKFPRRALHGRGPRNRMPVSRPAIASGNANGKAPIDLTEQRLRVLVVDDHREGADTLAMLAGVWGHDVKRAYDGKTALALASTYRPDVLLLDIVMPRMSGIDLAPLVRQLPGMKDCLMIAVTGRTDAVTRRQCVEAGIDLFLIKPVTYANLKMLLALEYEFRLRSRRVDLLEAVSPAALEQRRRKSSSRHARPDCDVLQVTIAS